MANCKGFRDLRSRKTSNSLDAGRFVDEYEGTIQIWNGTIVGPFFQLTLFLQCLVYEIWDASRQRELQRERERKKNWKLASLFSAIQSSSKSLAEAFFLLHEMHSFRATTMSREWAAAFLKLRFSLSQVVSFKINGDKQNDKTKWQNKWKTYLHSPGRSQTPWFSSQSARQIAAEKKGEGTRGWGSLN